MGSDSWIKELRKHPEIAMGPGDNRGLELMAQFPQPSKAGFALAPGETRDFKWPLTDQSPAINALKNRPKPMGTLPTFTDISKDLASYYVQVYFTYLHPSAHPPITTDC